MPKRRTPPLPPIHCSFCGRPQREVGRLYAGPAAHICEECIALARDLLAIDNEIIAERPVGAATIHVYRPEERRGKWHCTADLAGLPEASEVISVHAESRDGLGALRSVLDALSTEAAKFRIKV